MNLVVLQNIIAHFYSIYLFKKHKYPAILQYLSYFKQNFYWKE